jgi:hypothetical protein
MRTMIALGLLTMILTACGDSGDEPPKSTSDAGASYPTGEPIDWLAHCDEDRTECLAPGWPELLCAPDETECPDKGANWVYGDPRRPTRCVNIMQDEDHCGRCMTGTPGDWICGSAQQCLAGACEWIPDAGP